MIVLGIDIGVTGAIAAIDSRGTCVIVDLPTFEIPGKRMVRRRLNGRGLLDIVRGLVPAGEPALAIIEDVHTMPGARNSPQSQGSLMHSRGVVETVIEIARIEMHAVSPQKWKRTLGLIGQEKSGGLILARKMYPTAIDVLKRVKDHNRAEALLIAHYGMISSH